MAVSFPIVYCVTVNKCIFVLPYPDVIEYTECQITYAKYEGEREFSEVIDSTVSMIDSPHSYAHAMTSRIKQII